MLNFLRRGMLLLLSYITTVIADATSYFSSLTTDEKKEYTVWLTDHSSSYHNHVFMSSSSAGGEPEDGAALFWNIDGDSIHFALAVRAEGWVGLGISEAGGMVGADMALYEASKPSEITDAYVVDSRSMPLKDDCQNWMLEGVTSENGWMIVETSRLLDTNDGQDHVIKNDEGLHMPPARIIAAWGEADTVSYHGQQKARSSVRLFSKHSNEEMEALADTLESNSDGHFEMTENEFEIPSEETYYHELCKTFDELKMELPEGKTAVTLIGAVPIITEETKEFVHHFTVYLLKDCTNSRESFLYRSMVYAWAPGDEGYALPDNVGFPIFDNAHNQAVFMQIHYNNPSFIANKKDSSGLKFYYSHDERTHQAGMLEIGDPMVSLADDIPEGLSKYAFTCPGACSSTFLGNQGGENEGVRILSEYLHMHKTGVRMTNEVIRGDDIFHKAVVDVYDYNQQGLFHVPQDSFQVLPGDSFRTTCYYKDGTAFGLSSQDEMCITFILYYPAKKSLLGAPWICPYEPFSDLGNGCAGELDFANLNDTSQLGRNFGGSTGECVDGPSAVNSPTIAAPTMSNNGQPTPTPEDKTVITNQPTQSPTTEPTSGVSWLGASFLVPYVSVLLLGMFM